MSSSPKTRRRKFPGLRFSQVQQIQRPVGTLISEARTTAGSEGGRQVTVSEGHPWPAPKGSKLKDIGGPFHTQKTEVVSPKQVPTARIGPEYVSGSASTRHFVTFNPVAIFGNRSTVDDMSVLYPPDLSSSDDDLDEMGATAIARIEPTNQVAALSTALIEVMREGLPSLVGMQTARSRADSIRKNAGGEYLNVQFGWAPLVSEIRKTVSGIKKSDEILAQYERDAGRVVRRKYYFPSDVSSSDMVMGPPSHGLPVILDGNATVNVLTKYLGQISRNRKITKRAWFSGAFTYYLPSGYDSRNRLGELAAKADRLGLNLTPEVLWNVAPWSWAVDWFANTGDVIHNLTAFKTNGLIMRYGYMMETTIIVDTYTWKYNSPQANYPLVAPLVIKSIIKKRRPANPFGFGVSWNDLSPFQLSIAAALGLSRGR